MTLATTRGSVYRGTTQNGLGDEVDDNGTPIAGLVGFPVSIIESTRQVLDPSSGEQRTIRVARGRPLDARLDIRDGDRLGDDRTGKLYAITEVTRTARSVAGAAALLLDLQDNEG